MKTAMILLFLATPALAQQSVFDDMRAIINSQEFVDSVVCAGQLDTAAIQEFCLDVAAVPKGAGVAERLVQGLTRIEQMVKANASAITSLKSRLEVVAARPVVYQNPTTNGVAPGYIGENPRSTNRRPPASRPLDWH